MLNRRLITIGVAAAAVLALTGCTSGPADSESNVDGGKHAVSKEIPATTDALIDLACDITEKGDVTRANAQQLNGFGMYMTMYANDPASIPKGAGVSTAAEAQALADKYVPYGKSIFTLTLQGPAHITAELRPGLVAVCAGDVAAIS
jgi:hypothetical protein